MAMADLHRDSRPLTKIIHRNQIDLARPQGAGIQLLTRPDHHLPGITLDLDHIKWRARGDAQPLSLTDGKVVDPAVLANRFPVGCDQLTRPIRQRVTLFSQVSVEEALVVSTRNKADFLRVGLLSKGKSALTGQFTHLRLPHLPQRK